MNNPLKYVDPDGLEWGLSHHRDPKTNGKFVEYFRPGEFPASGWDRLPDKYSYKANDKNSYTLYSNGDFDLNGKKFKRLADGQAIPIADDIPDPGLPGPGEDTSAVPSQQTERGIGEIFSNALEYTAGSMYYNAFEGPYDLAKGTLYDTPRLMRGMYGAMGVPYASMIGPPTAEETREAEQTLEGLFHAYDYVAENGIGNTAGSLYGHRQAMSPWDQARADSAIAWFFAPFVVGPASRLGTVGELGQVGKAANAGRAAEAAPTIGGGSRWRGYIPPERQLPPATGGPITDPSRLLQPATVTQSAIPEELVNLTGDYGPLTRILKDTGIQANHLNQNAVFESVIPQSQGFSLGMRGDAFRGIGSPHYEFHRSLELFWDQYRAGGAMAGQVPTNGQYGAAVTGALEAAGLSSRDAATVSAWARQQRLQFGLLDAAPVIRIPRRMWQLR